jgi:hypothetical protein
MRRIQKLLGVAAPVVFAVAGSNIGSASAASQPRPLTMAEWQAEIGQVPVVGSGCFQASFPSLLWHDSTCATAPEWPFAPAAPSSLRSRPDTVGNGVDYSGEVSGSISKATGTFTDVSPNISEKGQVGGSGSKKANEFSLQLNTEFFSGSPACAGANNPSACLAWQQFVYTTSPNIVFMQYWLIDYDTTCPGTWFTYSGTNFIDCYTNSSASTLSGGALTAKSLASLSLSGSAKSGGNDKVEVTSGGLATMAIGSDSKIDLAPNWNTTEWGVYGDGGGGEAYFGTNTTLEAVTKLTATSSSAPTCVKEGFTGETNNLKLAATPALGSTSSPTMASKQTNGTAGTKSCAVAA